MEIIGIVIVWSLIIALAFELKARNERIRIHLSTLTQRSSSSIDSKAHPLDG